ncbi:MAG: hypothetical protein FJX76_07685 [Armatimonadetes bacterium]|nr:hypothetical protein [Armatimonadota bacterium]
MGIEQPGHVLPPIPFHFPFLEIEVEQIPVNFSEMAQAPQAPSSGAAEWLNSRQRLAAVRDDKRRLGTLEILQDLDAAGLELGHSH